MKIKFPDKNKILSITTLRIGLAVLGVIIVLFNDVFGKIEGFIEFLSLYFIAIGIAVAQWLFVNIRYILNLKSEKTKAELLHLQSQVNPHFFFNMLNNLYGLIDRDSQKAKGLILKLSDMMRYSIYEGQKEYVSLAQEIAFIKNYMELNEMRYHKQVDLDLKLDIEDEEIRLMPLLFIILVENAFKHGVEKLRNNAYVHIRISSDKKHITMEISNNFDKDDWGEKGIGIDNLKRRLELAYPKKHKLSTSIADGVYTSKLILSL